MLDIRELHFKINHQGNAFQNQTVPPHTKWDSYNHDDVKSKCWWDVVKLEFLYISGGNVKWYNDFGKLFDSFLKS